MGNLKVFALFLIGVILLSCACIEKVEEAEKYPGYFTSNSIDINSTDWNTYFDFNNIFYATDTDGIELNSTVAGIQGYFRFDEISGNIAYDIASNNDGALGGATPNRTDGKYGGALNFSRAYGAMRFVDLGQPTPSEIQLTDINFTITFWVNKLTGGLIQPQTLLSNRYSSSINGYRIEFYSSDVRLLYSDGTDIMNLISEGYDDKLNQWTHVGLSFDCDTRKMKVYQDGVYIEELSSTISGCINSTTRGFVLGANVDGGNCFDGSIDDIRIYHRLLNATEINATRDYVLYTDQNATSNIFDAVSMSGGSSADKIWGFKTNFTNTINTTVQAYWNYSTDNASFYIEDIGILTTDTYYRFGNKTRYGSLILRIQSTNNQETSVIENVELFAGDGVFITKPRDQKYKGTSIVVEGAVTWDAYVEYSMNGAANITTCSNCQNYAFTEYTLNEGANSITVYATNATLQDSVTRSFTMDSIAPGPVTELTDSAKGEHWINWTWVNPTDTDFDHVEIWLNNVFQTNVATTFYNATELDSWVWYTINTRTVDDVENSGTWVNDTVKTSDWTAPIITFTIATPNNYSTIRNWALINISVNEDVTSDLWWNGANESWQTSINNHTFYSNKTSLSGNYTFKAYVEDDAGNEAVTFLRWVNTSVPLMSFDDEDTDKFWVQTDGDNTCTGAWQCNYYQCGSNCSWATINKSANTITQGDTVTIRGGIYNEMVIMANNGTLQQPITFKTWDGIPIIDAERVHNYGIRLISKHDIIIKGITVINGGFGFRTQYCENITFNDIVANDCYAIGTNDGIGIGFSFSKNITLSGYSSVGNALFNLYLYNTSYSLFENCSLYITTGDAYSADYGVHTEHANYNIFRNISIINLHPTITGHRGHGIAIRVDSNHNIMEDCYSYGMYEHFVIGELGDYNIFRNCTVNDHPDHPTNAWWEAFVAWGGASNNQWIDCVTEGVDRGIHNHYFLPHIFPKTDQDDNLYTRCTFKNVRQLLELKNSSGNVLRNCVVDGAQYINYLCSENISCNITNTILSNISEFGDETWYSNITINYSILPEGGALNYYLGTENNTFGSSANFADANNNDYHLDSRMGRWNGSTWTYDLLSSAGIDAGNPLDDCSNEPGDAISCRINMGIYGNTAEASKGHIPLLARQWLETTEYNNTHITYDLVIWIYNNGAGSLDLNVNVEANWTDYNISGLLPGNSNITTLMKLFNRTMDDIPLNVSAAIITGDASTTTNTIDIIVPVDPPSKAGAIRLNVNESALFCNWLENETMSQILANESALDVLSHYDSYTAFWSDHWRNSLINVALEMSNLTSAFGATTTKTTIQIVNITPENIYIPANKWVFLAQGHNISATLAQIKAAINSDGCNITEMYAWDIPGQKYTSNPVFPVRPNRGFVIYSVDPCTYDGVV